MEDNSPSMGIFKMPLRSDPKQTTDSFDIEILRKINGGVDGTVELANQINMAPKNLLNRIKKYTRLELIEISKTPQKPKGWKRHFKLSQKGIEWIKNFDDFQEKLRSLDSNKEKDGTRDNTGTNKL